MQRPIPMIAACAISLLGSTAWAQDAYRAPTRSVAPAQDFRVNAGLGAFSGDTLDGGVMSALLATYRVGPVEVGGTLEGGSEVLGGGYSMVGAVAGPVWRSDFGLRVELLGVLGQDHYSGVGCGLFCSGGGASATLPYGGARAGASYAFGRRRAHFELGGSVFYGTDLEKQHVEYTTTGGLDLWGNGDNVNEDEMTLGGERMGGMLTLGLVVDG